MTTRRRPSDDHAAEETPLVRRRILDAAFALVQERGYAATSTRDIAARARVSKREIYSEFGNKAGIFAAMIAARSASMRTPLEQPDVSDRPALAATLTRIGVGFLEIICDPTVVSMFRMAISAAEHGAELARILDEQARAPFRHRLGELMARARDAGLVEGAPAELATRLVALLAGQLHVTLLLGLAPAPSSRQIAHRARAAAEAFLRLHGR